MSDQPTHAQLTQFVLHEARLLNAGDHDAWLALFHPEGRYWVPLLAAGLDAARKPR